VGGVLLGRHYYLSLDIKNKIGVTTHRPNELALKMDGAQAGGLHMTATCKCEAKVPVGGRGGQENKFISVAKRKRREPAWNGL
jgi:hypothetical protein